jgi:hypothetical protein
LEINVAVVLEINVAVVLEINVANQTFNKETFKLTKDL